MTHMLTRQVMQSVNTFVDWSDQRLGHILFRMHQKSAQDEAKLNQLVHGA